MTVALRTPTTAHYSSRLHSRTPRPASTTKDRPSLRTTSTLAASDACGGRHVASIEHERPNRPPTCDDAFADVSYRPCHHRQAPTHPKLAPQMCSPCYGPVDPRLPLPLAHLRSSLDLTRHPHARGLSEEHRKTCRDFRSYVGLGDRAPILRGIGAPREGLPNHTTISSLSVRETRRLTGPLAHWYARPPPYLVPPARVRVFSNTDLGAHRRATPGATSRSVSH